jgi:hypothetical protein
LIVSISGASAPAFVPQLVEGLKPKRFLMNRGLSRPVFADFSARIGLDMRFAHQLTGTVFR